MSVMYIRDKSGNLAPVHTLKGNDGKDYVQTNLEQQKIIPRFVDNQPSIREDFGRAIIE